MSDAHSLRESLGLRCRLPPEKPFISLSHAISWIALRRSVSGPVLSKLLGIGHWPQGEQLAREIQLDKAIKSAVEQLTNLGLSGAVHILGKPYIDVLDWDDNGGIPTQPIRAVEFADCRGFDTLDDTLFPDACRKIKLAWGTNRGDVHSPLGRHYRFVMVSRADLIQEFPDQVAPRLTCETFTDEERKQWIRDQPRRSADGAHKLYKLHPRYDRTKQREFREEWKAERGTRIGRPSNKS